MPRGIGSVRNWCFTLNNYNEETYSTIIEFCEGETKYWIIGRERAPTTGTPHLQGFFSLRDRHDLDYVRDKLPPGVHCEIARGSAQQNREYCSKGGEYREGGTLLTESTRLKTRDELASEFRLAIRRGNSGLAEYADSNPGTWGFSGFTLLRNAQLLTTPIERPDIRVEWIYGVPGIGKSRRAHETLPNAYIKELRTKWWNGYLQEKEVIIDDFAAGGIDINHLLRWFDRYKCMVENKGGMLALHADRFIITSNFHPSEVYFGFGGVPHPQLDAFLRRVTLMYLE